MAERVELGFIERASPEELTSPFFPSKVGGKPAWLDPTHLPAPEEISCNVCGVPRSFLLQIYAPLPDTPGAFHRTFFLFMCLNPSCHQHNDARGFRVFRCQLTKKNPFYDENSEDEGESECTEDDLTVELDRTCQVNSEQNSPIRGIDLHEEVTESVEGEMSRIPSSQDNILTSTTVSSSKTTVDAGLSQMKPIEPTPLCVVCGCAGPKKCSRCKMACYCSKHHQTHDWKNGHKLFCSDLASGKCKPGEVTYDPSYGVCLPEFEVVTEEEPAVKEGKVEDRKEEERMRDYHKFVQLGKYCNPSKEGGKQVQGVMEKAESDAKSDKVFNAFRRRVAMEPEQVIRYQRGGHPLLVSQEGAPQSTDIPPCVCGAQRQFEFQVMPQLLYYLKLDAVSETSVDWGTVIIYSCRASCTTHHAATSTHSTDLVWKQDFSTSKSK